MRMKKTLLGVGILLGVFLLASCGKQVTQKDLMKNKWEVTDTNDTDASAKAIASFSKTDMTVTFEMNENDTNAKDVEEEWGEQIGKEMLSNMAFEIAYTIEEGVIHLENKDLGLDGDFNVRKEDQSIIFRSEDTKANMILSPYNK